MKNVVKPVVLKQGVHVTVKWSTGELFACMVTGVCKLRCTYININNMHYVCIGSKKAMEAAEAKEIKQLEKSVKKNNIVQTVSCKTKKRAKRKRNESDKVRSITLIVQFISCVSSYHSAGKTCKKEGI